MYHLLGDDCEEIRQSIELLVFELGGIGKMG
jgi:hypothetical protein